MSFVRIESSVFFNNSGFVKSQAVLFSYQSSILVQKCLFTNSTGSVFHIKESNLTDYSSIYEYNDNTVNQGAVLHATWSSNLTYINSQFSNNFGSVLRASEYGSLNLNHCDLTQNTAAYHGAISVEFCTVNVENCTFCNLVAGKGSAIFADAS